MAEAPGRPLLAKKPASGCVRRAGWGPGSGAGSGGFGELLEVVLELVEGDRADVHARLVRAAWVVVGPGRRLVVVVVVVMQSHEGLPCWRS
jgi:hypothetical protein